jgi:cbb3-type cytochrome oxidase maturation protein
VVVLSVVVGLLLVAGGLMTFLWLDTSGQLDDTRADLTSQVDELNDTVAARDGEVDRLGTELQEAQDSLTDAETQLEGTENTVDELEENQDTIRECILLLGAANVALEEGDEAEADALEAQAEPICEEADRILGF